MTSPAIPAITPDVISEHGLTPEEYEKVKRLLGREPSITELGIFSVMWSEHCSYKSSRVHLKRLPTRSRRVVQGPGENAGIIDTGVGGILRDIFTMGARPVVIMDSLRFGPTTSAGDGAHATQAQIHKNHSVL